MDNTRSSHVSVEHMVAQHAGRQAQLERLHPVWVDYEHRLDHAVINDLGHSHDEAPTMIDVSDHPAPAIVFDVPMVRWPTEATFTLVRDCGLREGQVLTLDQGGAATTYRITKIVAPDEDEMTPTWTVSAVEWQQDADGDSPAVRSDH